MIQSPEFQQETKKVRLLSFKIAFIEKSINISSFIMYCCPRCPHSIKKMGVFLFWVGMSRISQMRERRMRSFPQEPKKNCRKMSPEKKVKDQQKWINCWIMWKMTFAFLAIFASKSNLIFVDDAIPIPIGAEPESHLSLSQFAQ